jgi:type IV secretory pathway VirB10-like protein
MWFGKYSGKPAVAAPEGEGTDPGLDHTMDHTRAQPKDRAIDGTGSLEGNVRQAPPRTPRTNRGVIAAALVLFGVIAWAVAFSGPSREQERQEKKAYTGAPLDEQRARYTSQELERERARLSASLGPRDSLAGSVGVEAVPSPNAREVAFANDPRLAQMVAERDAERQAASGGSRSGPDPLQKALESPLTPEGWGDASRPGAARRRAAERAERDPDDPLGIQDLQRQVRERLSNQVLGATSLASSAYSPQLGPAVPGTSPGAGSVYVPGASADLTAASPIGTGPAASASGSRGAVRQHGAGWLSADGGTSVLENPVVAPTTRYLLQQGTLIPAVLETAINSDLPGQTRALVSRDVYDSASGRYLLIPQGSRLIGEYASRIVAGQERLLVAWNRVLFPDGRSLSLEGMPGADRMGAAGLSEQVNYHFFKVFGHALLLSAISAGYQIATDDDDNASAGGILGTQNLSPSEITSLAIAQEFHRASSELLRRNANIPPTLTIRHGYGFTVQVTADVALPGTYVDTRDSEPVLLPREVKLR